MLSKYRGRHVLLLQGPAGPFFSRIANDLRSAGARVTKVNFNGGDWLFFRGPNAVAFRGRASQWPTWLEALIEARGITDLVVFGDMRPFHYTAIRIARSMGVCVGVFEEGYLRPDYVTFEREGVNGNSRMVRDPEFYRRAPIPVAPDPIPVGNTVLPCALWSTLYAIATTLLWAAFPHYRHHRPINFVYHTAVQLRGAVRKLVNGWRERNALETLVEHHDGRYYVVPLQVHCDAQLQHSPYDDVTSFMDEVAASFAASAPPDSLLVFKHHPMDRAYRDYRGFVRTLSKKHGLVGRLRYVHDVHLPTLLRHALGAVVINSTVGLSAIHHQTPVKVMGTAIYDMAGLTHQGSLAQFWSQPDAVDPEIYQGFRAWLLYDNQINGSVWSKPFGPAKHMSLYWRTPEDGSACHQPATLDDRSLHSLL